MLKSALEGGVDDPPETAGTPNLPRVFGPYELIEEIGRGGMGVVYKATQPVLGRTVAVKLLLSGAYSSEAALRRFRLEASAAAGLQHPHIVAIHDYGECDGQPYYAMDLITGQNLAALCDGRPLPAREAAEILRLLAGAVAYAHQRGILHRDLKPSNVLIDEHGQPKIADFGVSRRLDGSEGATLTGQMVGSPSYASPEQAAGLPSAAAVASDVYGLGALFYHLLTGRAPFNAATPAETLRLVLDTEPAPPRLLNPDLPRDLETICLKCLAKEPARRYASAAEVAEELERYLSHRPVHARPPSAFYRLRKFTRRHRVIVGAATAVFLALVGGLTFALIGFRRAVEQKRVADTARSQAQRLTGFILKDLQPDMLDHGRLQSQKLTIEGAVRYFDLLPPELRDDVTIRDHAAALAALADLYGRKQGTVTITAENPERALAAAQRALAMRRQLAAKHPDDRDAALAVCLSEAQVTYNDPVAWVRLDQAFPDHIQKLREMEKRFSGDTTVQRALAQALLDWAYHACFTFGKPAEAQAAAAEGRERWQRLLTTAPDDKEVQIGYARSLATMAQSLAGPDEAAPASEWGEKALAYATELLHSDPTNLRLLAVAAETANRLARLAEASSLPRAREAERIAREHYRMLMTFDPGSLEWNARLAQAYDVEIKALADEGRLAQARSLEQQVIQLLEPAARDRNTKEMLANRMGTAASLALNAGDAADEKRQLAVLEEFARGQERALPEGSWERRFERIFWLIEECDILDGLNDWPALGRVAREALDETERGLRDSPDHENELLVHQAAAQNLLGRALLYQGRAAEAVPLFEQALAGFRDAPVGGSLGGRDYRAVWAAGALAEARQAAGDAAGALAASEAALAQAEQSLARAPDDLRLLEAAAEAARSLSYRAAPGKRSLEAELIARNHYRVLMERQPAHHGWRRMYATVHMMECWYLLGDGQIEPAREAFRRFDALIEPFSTQNARKPFEPSSTDYARTPWENRLGLALLAAWAGDAAGARAELVTAARRFDTFIQMLPESSPERLRTHTFFLQVEALVQTALGDWPALERLARELLDEITVQTSDGEMRLRRVMAHGLLGLALLRESQIAEAVPVLHQALHGFAGTPPVAAVSYAQFVRDLTTDAFAEALARTGDTAEARSLLESTRAEREATLAKDPESWALREPLARTLVLLAGMLDSADPADVARRTTLLDRATDLLTGPAAEGRLTVEGKASLASVAALRTAAEKPAGP